MGITYKTKQIPIKCSKSDYEYLKECNIKSAQVWNYILKIEHEYRNNHDNKWIQRNELQKLTKGYIDLPAKCIHHVCYRYLDARSGSMSARNGESNSIKNKLPHHQKRFMVTTWDYQQIKTNENYITLTKELLKLPNGKTKHQKPVKIFTKNIPSNIVQIELIYRNGLKLSIKYKEETKYLQIKSNNHAAIDLGEIHSITSIDSCGNALIITGRKIRSLKRLRNKEQSKIYRRMMRCGLNSIQYRKYKKALANLKEKFDNKIRDCVHKISHLYLNYCLENNISVVYYGDLDSATRGRKGEVSKIIGQKLNQWSYGEIVRQLTNKLSCYGIKLTKINEAYTSQTCPECGHRYHPNGRNYDCPECGFSQHRDIVGAMNILNFNEDRLNIKYYKSKKYLRIA
jgi:putative transposase